MIAISAILVLGSLVTIVQGQSECQCEGFVVFPDGNKQWFMTFEQHFPDSCTNATTCEHSCNNYISSQTNNYTLSAPFEGTTLAQYVCTHLGNDATVGSSILYQSQGCENALTNVHQIDGFGCTSGIPISS